MWMLLQLCLCTLIKIHLFFYPESLRSELVEGLCMSMYQQKNPGAVALFPPSLHPPFILLFFCGGTGFPFTFPFVPKDQRLAARTIVFHKLMGTPPTSIQCISIIIDILQYLSVLKKYSTNLLHTWVACLVGFIFDCTLGTEIYSWQCLFVVCWMSLSSRLTSPYLSFRFPSFIFSMFE